MKKYELEGLLAHICDIINDRYERPDMKLEIVFDLCAQAAFGDESNGIAPMPKFEKPNKKRSKKKP